MLLQGRIKRSVARGGDSINRLVCWELMELLFFLFSVTVKEMFSNKQISGRGTIPWPLRSTNLLPDVVFFVNIHEFRATANVLKLLVQNCHKHGEMEPLHHNKAAAEVDGV